MLELLKQYSLLQNKRHDGDITNRELEELKRLEFQIKLTSSRLPTHTD